MPVKKLKAFLDSEGIKYVTISHSKAYTAQEVAASAHIPGKEMAKTVMVKLDGDMAMVVLPADHKVHFDQLADALGVKDATLASEEEFKGLFPDCDPGAMPPFGNLYGMDVYIEEGLTDNQRIAFNAGSHTEVIRVPYKDFERLVKPKVFKAAN
ncbi:MAG: YbaK/EbsC family protein [Candidatus Hydrogenedentota bacterium]